MNTAEHRAQVRDFLTSRRERITPSQAGLPAYGGNRRVKGLRREEVALLAGVSIDYYVRLERGNLAGASDAVLDGVASALQLDDAERDHLFALARAAGPSFTRRRRPAATAVRPVIQQVLDAITDAPAWVRNARHDILAMNPLARARYSPVVRSAAAGATSKRPANTTRRALHAERAVRSALGLARRQVPPQRHQAAPPSRGRRTRPPLRVDGPSVRAGALPEHLHRRPGTPTSDGLKLLASWEATTQRAEIGMQT